MTKEEKFYFETLLTRRRISNYLYLYHHSCDKLQTPLFLDFKGQYLRASQLVSVEFFTDIKSFRSHYGPGVDSASNRNEFQVQFFGVKAAGA